MVLTLAPSSLGTTELTRCFLGALRAHGLIRLVRTDGEGGCPEMALNASEVKPHSEGVLETSAMPSKKLKSPSYK